MTIGLNRVMLIGNIGADPELRSTATGMAVLRIRMATTESYLDRDKNRKEQTEWHSITVWGRRGEALHAILTKGKQIFVEGALRTSSYDDKEGIKRTRTEIVAKEVILCGGRDGGAPGQRSSPSQQQSNGPDDFGSGNDGGSGFGGDDDIPF
jgi:single-strand DNA-binding protein